MRVMIAHSRYTTGALSGENRVVTDERALLLSAGHVVDAFEPMLTGPSLSAAIRVVWNRRAVTTVRQAGSGVRPDVIHLHNLFPNLSPAVARAGSHSGVPLVMTLHNFRLACLSAAFLRDGSVCEDCLGRRPWRGVAHGCYRGSRAQSAVIATSLSLHRAIGTFERVTLFAAVSQFVKNKLVESGLDEDRVRVRHNFGWPTQRRVGAGGYFLVLGRLSAEKGVDTIVGNWRSQLPLLVVGDGPDRMRLESLATPDIDFREAVEAEDVAEIVRGARAVLVPSTCYEGSPRVIVEAFAAGVPVIASRIGGLPEHVDDNVSGLLVTAGDPVAWTTAIERLEDDDTSERLGAGAYTAWQERFSPDVGLRSIEMLYEEAITRAENGRL